MVSDKLFYFLKNRLSIFAIIIVLLSSIYHHYYFDLPETLSWFYVIRTDFALIVLVGLLLYHCIDFLGKIKGLAFFFNVSIYIGGLEAFWVLMGNPINYLRSHQALDLFYITILFRKSLLL